MLTDISILPSHPLIVFEHLSLYILKHLGQSVAIRGISLWKGRSWQTKAEPGKSQVQSDTVMKRPIIYYIFKKQAL